jgi:hypothetical protein
MTLWSGFWLVVCILYALLILDLVTGWLEGPGD